MKYMIASDIHGSAYYCRKLTEAYEWSGAHKIILLGDLLYHGPRNELPKDYDPKAVIELLNNKKNEIYAVRGNCDSEVDQMVLEFPIMSDYCIFSLEDKAIFATHGHIYNKEHFPPMKKDDVLLHGHTHILQAEKENGYMILNPGSVSLPKDGNVPTFAILEEQKFTIYDFDKNIIKETVL